ncbi:MAG: ComF family protein [Gammaproteobacteria bacterium]|nr:ComF family protein [Gammaproteobacteria bacterium]
MWNGLVDLVYPQDAAPGSCRKIKFPYCELCGEPVFGEVSNRYECSNCSGRTWYIQKARAAYRAEADVLDWIHQCKYSSHWHRLPQLGQWLVDGYDQFYGDERFEAIVPVPLHWRRFWRRGFNQARELSLHLSRHSEIPLRDVLQRQKNTAVQASLSRKERMSNCRGAFRLKKRAFDVRGLRLLLIDDVFTTGSTVNACARQLKQQGGAREVSVLTVARGGDF